MSNKYLKNIKFLGEDFHMNIEIMLNVKKVSLINQYLYFYRMGGYTSKYMPYFFNDITEGYKAQKAVLNEYFCEEEHHYGGISIMLLNTFKTLIYNMFLSDLSSNEILNKIAEYLDDDQIKEASKNQEAINYFNKFDANYLKAVNNKDNYYLYEITKKVFKRNKYKRIIQNIL